MSGGFVAGHSDLLEAEACQARKNINTVVIYSPTNQSKVG